MPTNPPITAETLSRIAAQILGSPLSEANAAAAAGMLNTLGADMQALRKLEVAGEEPATTYAAIEGLP